MNKEVGLILLNYGIKNGDHIVQEIIDLVVEKCAIIAEKTTSVSEPPVVYAFAGGQEIAKVLRSMKGKNNEKA